MDDVIEIIIEIFGEPLLKLFSLIGKKILRTNRFSGKKKKTMNKIGSILGIVLLVLVVAGIIILICNGADSYAGWMMVILPIAFILWVWLSDRKNRSAEDSDDLFD
ncbi:MAG: hypothetical protein IJC19_01315 [Clostridia bacterium]|nr:hypothetical protein [Clostridia bacterium]